VPAWFAHNHSQTHENETNSKKVNINYPYNNEPETKPLNFNKYIFTSFFDKECEQFKLEIHFRNDKIEEPLKYGQLRNYLNPVNIKSNSNQRNMTHLQVEPTREKRM